MSGSTTPGVRLVNLTPALKISHATQHFTPTDEHSFTDAVSGVIAVLERTIRSFVLFIDGDGPEPIPPSIGTHVAIDDADPKAGCLVVIDHVGGEAMALVRFAARTIGRMAQERRDFVANTNRDQLHRAATQVLLDQSTVPMFAQDLAGRYVLCNDAFVKSFPGGVDPIGRTDDELAAQPVTTLDSPEHPQSDRSKAVNKFPLRDEDGEVIGVVGIGTPSGPTPSNDDPRVHLDALVSNSTMGLVRVGLDGRIEWSNTTMGTMLGLDADSLVGVHVNELSPKGDDASRAVSGEFIAAALAGEVTSKTFSKWVEHTDGHRLHVEITSHLVTAEDDEPLYFLSFVKDITDRIQRDHGIWQAEKMEAIGQVAASLAHDINNLLGGILGYSEILMERLDEGPARDECSVITTTALRAAQVTKQLLRFARQAPLMPDLVNVHDLIETSVATPAQAQPDGSEPHPVTFDVQLGAASSNVFGDVGSLQFVIDQLIANARTAIARRPLRSPGSIRIDTDNTFEPGPAGVLTRQFIRLRVTDDGIGMDEVTLRRAFEPFFTTSGVEGAGVGLASVHATVVNHGGSISATSHPGAGATFTVTIPVHPQPSSADTSTDRLNDAEPSTDEAHTPIDDPLPNIMVVDDDDVMRAFVVAALRRSGHRTVDFDNGPDAIAYFAAHSDQIQLAICDMVMPEMSGHELVSELRKCQPGVKVLMATGIDKNTPDPELGDTNAPVLQKPFRMAELAETVNSLLN